MKRLVTLLFASLLLASPVWGGGLLHNTNQNIQFVRMMARGASNDIDAIYSNPAGMAFFEHEGWTLSLSVQNASQSRDVLATFPLFTTPDHTKLYHGKASAPFVPSLYGAYKHNKWCYSAFFGFIGGGGKCSFTSGLPVFDAGIMAGIYGQTLGLRQTLADNPATAPILNDPTVSGLLPLTADKYNINSSMKGRQYIYGLQLGASYQFNNHWSGFAGLRVNYFDGNYNGFVKVLPGTDLSASIRQISISYPSLAPMISGLVNQNGEIANIALDCNQTGWGVTPILGINYKVGPVTMAAKYEFKTSLNIENDTKTAIAEPAAFDAALADYKDGVNTPSDLPAVLYVAVGCEIIPKKLRATAEYHFYDDKNAKMSHDKQKALKRGTNEILAGVEWDINRRFTVSGGFQKTDYGLSNDYQTHTSFSCDSYSLGFGGAVNITEKVRVNAGYFWTTYSDYTKDVDNYYNTTMPGKDVYSRTNKVFGIGIDYKF